MFRLNQIVVARTAFVPIRQFGGDHAEMVNQMLLGETARVLAVRDSMWLEVETHTDRYKGFVSVLMVLPAPEKWPITTNNRIQNRFVDGTAEGREVRVPMAGVLVQEGNDWFLPDGRRFIPNQEPKMASNPMYFVESVIQQAEKLLDVPYLWGGRSVYGVDCSGLTHTAALLSGLPLPRDSYMQARFGAAIPPEIGMLERGDWLFFSNNPEGRITHVALYEGEGMFIHASGFVRKNSLIPGTSLFSERQKEQFVFARRIRPKSSNPSS
ncbi:MAG TPA: NlpC/P60 family protein [Rhodothermales bacterium]|nr:NlpC/P60 family protein [Rhodothermales bacterium]HRR07577.1 NlpC/P60 family protein [Rhodothermales bacterium]